jgi:hypothetical protein
MKKKIAALFPLVALLTSCPIVNPLYPQDELDVSKYQEPITLDWTNDDESEGANALFDDAEVLRTYLNNPRAAIKEITSFTNVFRGRGALRLGQRTGEREGELTITLKNTFKADAIAIKVYPYYYNSFSSITGKTESIYDSFAISINERDFIDLKKNDDVEAYVLTFRFQEPTELISIKTQKGRGHISSLNIYQK